MRPQVIKVVGDRSMKASLGGRRAGGAEGKGGEAEAAEGDEDPFQNNYSFLSPIRSFL